LIEGGWNRLVFWRHLDSCVRRLVARETHLRRRKQGIGVAFSFLSELPFDYIYFVTYDEH
jgi:hypothetical protein